MKILFKLTSRSRPHKFFEALDSIISNVSAGCDYQVICSLDVDDTTMINTALLNHDRVEYFFGVSKNKIDAINRDVPSKGWDILVNVSDDNRFIKKDFDKDIEAGFVEGHTTLHYRLDQCLHFPDQNQGTNCMTMSIMGCAYYERDNFIYNPAFESLWCDVVAQEVAQLRNCYKFIPVNIFSHLHPSFGQVPYDEQYKRTEGHEVRMRDYATYRKLKTQYDPLTIYPIRNP